VGPSEVGPKVGLSTQPARPTQPDSARITTHTQVCGYALAERCAIGHDDCVDSPFDRVARSFFTVLGLAVICLPLLGLASNDSLRWGTVPEWVGAFGILLIAAGVWKIARTSERQPGDRDARNRANT